MTDDARALLLSTREEIEEAHDLSLDGHHTEARLRLRHAIERIAALLAREPEPVAWVNKANLASAVISRERGGPFDTHTWAEERTDYHDTPLYLAAPAPAAPAAPDAGGNR